MRPEIILHVGTEKTGSTSIQRVLLASREELQEQRILYPSSLILPSHVHLTACALDDQVGNPLKRLLKITNANEFNSFKERTLASFREEAGKYSPDTIVISDEHINVHLNNKKYLEEFRRICEEFGDIQKVIIYLRRQDEFKLSMFSQSVKSGVISASALDNPLTIYEKIPYRLDYMSILDNLSSVFGREKIAPVIYNRVRRGSGGVVSDFLTRANILLVPETITSYTYNRSIDARIIKPLATISSLLKSANTRYTDVLRKKIIKLSEKVFNGPGPQLTRDAHAGFMAQFENQNRQIKQEYFSDLEEDDKLFPDEDMNVDMGTRLYPECSISFASYLSKILSFSLKSALLMRVTGVKE
jgi:hypothetical protein